MKVSNNRLILIILSILCFVMIGVTTLRDEWLSPLRTAVGYLLMPVQSGVNRVGRSLYNSIRDHEELKSALQDKRELQEQVDQLIMENTRLQADRFELDRLRRLYELNREYGQYRMTGARVIAKDTGGWFHIFRIDKGSADGIRPDMNVLAGGGLIGIVTDVGANYATVRSIIDDVSRVSAMAMQSGDTCIVSGDLQLYSEGLLRISDITDTADIKDGDKIVTSTVSAKFLPGILIGYAKDLRTDASRLTRSGTLVPAADFGTLQEVLVVTELKSEFRERTEREAAEAAASGAVPDGIMEETAGSTAEEPSASSGTETVNSGETSGEGMTETEAQTEETEPAAPATAAETAAAAPTEESTDSVVIVEGFPGSSADPALEERGPGV